MNGPRRAWIVARESSLAVTWDFMLGVSSARRRKRFRAEHRAEIKWPAGAYQVSGWTFPPESDEGLSISQYVPQLEP